MLQTIVSLEIVIAIVSMILMLRHQQDSFRTASILLLVCISINVIGNFLAKSPSFESLVFGVYNGSLMMIGAGTPDFATDIQGGDIMVTALLVAFYLAGICALFATIELAVSALASQWLEYRRVSYRKFSKVFLVSSTPDSESAARSFVESVAAHNGSYLIAVRGFEADERPGGTRRGPLVTSLYDLARDSSELNKGALIYEIHFLDTRVRVERRVGGSSLPIDVSTYCYDELAARDLVNSRVIPSIADEIRFGKYWERTDGLHVLVVGSIKGLAGYIARQFAMNSQMPPQGDGQVRNLPIIEIWSCEQDDSAGWFEESYPSFGLAAMLSFHYGDVRSSEFYSYVKENQFDWIVFASQDDEDNISMAKSMQFSLRKARLKILPQVVVRCREPWRYEGVATGMQLFGSDEMLLDCDSLINGKNDDRAKLVNAFYSGISPQDAIINREISGQANEMWWASTTQFDRDSSRASAGFAEVERAWLDAYNNGVYTCQGNPIEHIAQLEHQRWIAFYVSSGFSPMSFTTMRRRYRYAQEMREKSDVDQEGPIASSFTVVPGKYARSDGPEYGDSCLEHICIVPWDELPDVSAAYNELTGEHRDFQQSDRDVIHLIDYLDAVDWNSEEESGSHEYYRTRKLSS